MCFGCLEGFSLWVCCDVLLLIPLVRLPLGVQMPCIICQASPVDLVYLVGKPGIPGLPTVIN